MHYLSVASSTRSLGLFPYAGLAMLMITGLGSTTCWAQQPVDCRSPELGQQAVRVVDGSSIFLSGPISILDGPLNARENSYFHTTDQFAGISHGREYPCVAGVVTSHGLMSLYYGMRNINEKTYIAARLVPKDDDDHADTSDYGHPAAPTPKVPRKSSWADVLPQVKLKCAQEFQNDYQLQSYCVDAQRKGWTQLNGDEPAQAVQQAPFVSPPMHQAPVSGSPVDRLPSYQASAANNATPPPSDTSSVSQSVGKEDPDFSSFQKGKRDRIAWEAFIGGIVGDEREGAVWWSGQRSLKNPGSCSTTRNDQYRHGCEEAQAILGPADVLRKTNPAFRAGWNSL